MVETSWIYTEPPRPFAILIDTVPSVRNDVKGNAQFGHAPALSETSLPHSGHLISAIIYSPFMYISGKNKKCANRSQRTEKRRLQLSPNKTYQAQRKPL
jgi:hypothetical protein